MQDTVLFVHLHQDGCWLLTRRLCMYGLSGLEKLDMNDVNEESKMSHLMKGTDPSTPFKSAMYGVVVWMFVRSGCDHDAYQLFDELYNKVLITKECYMGYILFVVTLIISVVITPIPLWMVIFTVLPIFIAMVPFKIIGTLHYSAIISFVGWLILIAIL